MRSLSFITLLTLTSFAAAADALQDAFVPEPSVLSLVSIAAVAVIVARRLRK